ncbi:S-adenosylmethionine decarboxylase [Candidatus Pacearchaeota archaeon]|nr:S-adenosylmethionine decarboxylase [Candidatus Pacearchaeota archaeon]
MEWGKLTIIDLHSCNKEKIRNKKEIRKFVYKLCDNINMKRFGPTRIKRFGEGKLKGYSAIQFLQTSSITIHFDEEKNRAFIDIFSCKKFNDKKAEKLSKEFFNAKKSKSRVLFRK